MTSTNAQALQWLLEAGDASVRYLALTELLDYSPDSAEAREAQAGILKGPRVKALLAGQRRDGGFGGHPYVKWTGAHWRLVSLVELGIPAGEPRALAAYEGVLAWLTNDERRDSMPVLEGRVRQCASMEGNALAVGCRLGLAGDERVAGLARSLVEWQWPDGGWNCDKNPAASHSSFYESLPAMWGLIEYYKATGDRASRKAAKRAAELFLQHRLFRSDKTGEVMNPEWLKLHYPLYWHYDILQALVILSRLGPLSDPRLGEALDVVEGKRRKDGRWQPGNYYWRPAGGKDGASLEAVDWGRGGPNVMITLNALRVLKASGRFAGND